MRKRKGKLKELLTGANGEERTMHDLGEGERRE